MHFFVYLLLISGVSMKIGETVDTDEIKEYLEEKIKKGKTRVNSRITLSYDEILGHTSTSLVWLGYYNKRTPVAIKIIGDSYLMATELSIFTALNAIENDVSAYGIPTVYYAGDIFRFTGIAMTLFYGSLDKYYYLWKQKSCQCIPYSNILSIFKQMVIALRYLNHMHVVHNDIKPANIFYFGEKFYIGDFGIATLNGAQNVFHNPRFASSNAHGGRPRGAMDDLQSLVFTMWHISGIELGKSSRCGSENKQEGQILNKYNKGKYKDRVEEKLSKFNDNAHVHEVFRYICVDEMLAKQDTPNYDRIIGKLDEAINQIGGPIKLSRR